MIILHLSAQSIMYCGFWWKCAMSTQYLWDNHREGPKNLECLYVLYILVPNHEDRIYKRLPVTQHWQAPKYSPERWFSPKDDASTILFNIIVLLCCCFDFSAHKKSLQITNQKMKTHICFSFLELNSYLLQTQLWPQKHILRVLIC